MLRPFAKQSRVGQGGRVGSDLGTPELRETSDVPRSRSYAVAIPGAPADRPSPRVTPVPSSSLSRRTTPTPSAEASTFITITEVDGDGVGGGGGDGGWQNIVENLTGTGMPALVFSNPSPLNFQNIHGRQLGHSYFHRHQHELDQCDADERGWTRRSIHLWWWRPVSRRGRYLRNISRPE